MVSAADVEICEFSFVEQSNQWSAKNTQTITLSDLLQLLFEVVGDLGKLGFIDHSGALHVTRLRWHLESLRQRVCLSYALNDSFEVDAWMDGVDCATQWRRCRQRPNFVSHK